MQDAFLIQKSNNAIGMEETELQKNLKRLLAEKNLSMKEVSLRAGYSHVAVRNILVGRSRNPSYALLSKIASVLGCTVADLQGLGQSIPILGTISGDIIELKETGETAPAYSQADGVLLTISPINGLIAKNSFVYFQRITLPHEDMALPCVVHLKDGRTFLKKIMPGYQAGKYNLLGISMSDVLLDQEIEWAGIITAWMPTRLSAR